MKCNRDGCQTDATWQIVLLLFARPHTVPARGELGLFVCDDCRAAVHWLARRLELAPALVLAL